jgi:hypothetical protein
MNTNKKITLESNTGTCNNIKTQNVNPATKETLNGKT